MTTTSGGTNPGTAARGRFCFVVSELIGHRAAGGIATATTFLAHLLRAAGHEVTLFDAAADHEPLSRDWADRYRALGIEVVRIDRRQAVGPHFIADSYRTYQQLKHAAFDVIVFQDWLGLGYCSLSAKRSGLAFAESRLVHIVHGPTEWLWEANQTVELHTPSFATAHLERRAAELADTVVGPSAYLLGWMAQRWELPADRRRIFYPTAGMVGLRSVADPSDGGAWSPAPLQELVFFGRYEERKGIRIFCEALNRLGPQRLSGLLVSFLGRAVPYGVAEVTAMLDPAVVEALGGLSFITDKDSLAARAHLAEPGRVALIPSLIDNSPNVVIECVEDGTSFLAAASGGIPELVAAADHERVLFQPTVAALTERLDRLLRDGVTPAPAAAGWKADEILPAWEALLDRPAPMATITERPLVSVVIPHHDQLALFVHTLRSVVLQDHPNLEIVVVDDGTRDREAVRRLAELVAQPWGRPISLVRQDNRYLGAARNTGVRNARADLIAFVDDDDVLEAHYVSTLLTALLATGAGAATSALVNHADDGSDLASSSGWPFVFPGDAVQLAPIWNTVGGAGCLVRREAWEAAGGFHTRHGVGHEDWTLLVSIALSGRPVVGVPEPLYRYRTRRTSMLRSTSRYRNMQPVLDAFTPHLPAALRAWPELLHGQQQLIDTLLEHADDLRIAQERLVDVRDRLDAAQQELDELRRERDALRASLTYRVGRAVLGPPRRLRASRPLRRP